MASFLVRELDLMGEEETTAPKQWAGPSIRPSARPIGTAHRHRTEKRQFPMAGADVAASKGVMSLTLEPDAKVLP